MFPKVTPTTHQKVIKSGNAIKSAAYRCNSYHKFIRRYCRDPADIKRVVYTTNIIESVHRKFKK